MLGTRILVVEDDAALRDVLVRGLRQRGAEVLVAVDGSTALARVDDQPNLDLVVLDIGLPDSDGRDVCQAMRARGVLVPVVFLTARGQVADLVSGFAAGGDDYVAKPFHFAELVARIEGLLRRRGSVQTAPGDGLRLDPRTHALSSPTGRSVLTPIEYRLMGRLMQSPGEVVRRRDLVLAAWPEGAIVHDNTLDQYLAKLRRKLADVTDERRLETVRGVGHRFL